MSEVVRIDKARRELDLAKEPPEFMEIEAKLDAIEKYMIQQGLYSTVEIRPVNETKMRCRWLMGQALAKKDRGAGPGRGKKVGDDHPSFKRYIEGIGRGGSGIAKP